MNRKEFEPCLLLVWMLACSVGWSAPSARIFVGEGNGLYAQGNFNEALNRYDQALTEDPKAVQAKFNKANCYLRLGDIDQAKNLYRQVAVESKDMSLVERAKYNLGNTLFQEGLKQQDSDLQKSVEGLKDAIVQWQATLELNESNGKAGKNIEVARLMIKDIMDQIKKQQEQQDPNQPQDPNQSPNPQQQGTQQDENAQDPNQTQSQQPSDAEQDPSQDPNQPQPSPQQEDPNQSQEPQSQPENPRDMEQDMTAQRILDKEQRQNRARRQRRRMQNRKVIRDW
ncbi:MAG: tetratricopeptide repeat protein [Planctomycetes bacterium]|nr:tetratricopeptide repeat protein [Planctomycetota bacterium]